MVELVSWVATGATIIAALMTASNLGTRITGYGFCVFLVGSVCWLATGLLTQQPALSWTNAVLTALNTFGIWRWLGRQTRVEEGGRAAADASRDTPGETLFPVSLLARVPVECSGKQVGHAIDAMAGCNSGQLTYVVVSAGGVAGVGEEFRRLSWSDAQIDEGRLMCRLTPAQFLRLEELPRDEWPAR